VGVPGNANVSLPKPPPLCPWCQMPMPDLPHKDAGECIEALEREIRALRLLLGLGERPRRIPDEERFKREHYVTSGA
jgi:hypothetical protein